MSTPVVSQNETPPAPAGTGARKLTERAFRIRESGIIVVLVVFVAVTASVQPRFLTRTPDDRGHLPADYGLWLIFLDGYGRNASRVMGAGAHNPRKTGVGAHDPRTTPSPAVTSGSSEAYEALSSRHLRQRQIWG